MIYLSCYDWFPPWEGPRTVKGVESDTFYGPAPAIDASGWEHRVRHQAYFMRKKHAAWLKKHGTGPVE